MMVKNFEGTKFRAGLTYMSEYNDTWYIIVQTGQRTWVATDIKNTLDSEYMYTGNAPALFKQLGVWQNITYSCANTDKVGIRKAIMSVMVGKKPDSIIETSAYANEVVIKINERI